MKKIENEPKTLKNQKIHKTKNRLSLHTAPQSASVEKTKHVILTVRDGSCHSHPHREIDSLEKVNRILATS